MGLDCYWHCWGHLPVFVEVLSEESEGMRETVEHIPIPNSVRVLVDRKRGGHNPGIQTVALIPEPADPKSGPKQTFPNIQVGHVELVLPKASPFLLHHQHVGSRLLHLEQQLKCFFGGVAAYLCRIAQ